MENPITFDIDKYDERSMRSFKILDQINHPNLYKIYPKIFCVQILKSKNVRYMKIKNFCIMMDFILVRQEQK